MVKHDLTGSLETSFTFGIAGKEFEFRKPTVREMRAVAKQFGAIEKEEDVEKQQDMSDQAMTELYKFCKPLGHSEDLKALMDEQPMGVQLAFNNMIKEELTANN